MPAIFRLVLSGWGAASLQPERLGTLLVSQGLITLPNWRRCVYYRLHDPRLRFISTQGVPHNIAHGREIKVALDPDQPNNVGSIRAFDLSIKETRIMLQFVPPGATLEYIKTILEQAGLTFVEGKKSERRADLWTCSIKEEEDRVPHYIEGTGISKEGQKWNRKPILVNCINRLIKCYFCQKTDHWSNKCTTQTKKANTTTQAAKRPVVQTRNIAINTDTIYPQEAWKVVMSKLEKDKDHFVKDWEIRAPALRRKEEEERKREKEIEEKKKQKELERKKKEEKEKEKQEKKRREEKEKQQQKKKELEKKKREEMEEKKKQLEKEKELEKKEREEKEKLQKEKEKEEEKKKAVEGVMGDGDELSVGTPVGESPKRNASPQKRGPQGAETIEDDVAQEMRRLQLISKLFAGTGGNDASPAPLPVSPLSDGDVAPGKPAADSAPATRNNKRNLSISPPSELVTKKSKAKGGKTSSAGCSNQSRPSSEGKEFQMDVNQLTFRWNSDSEDEGNQVKIFTGGESTSSASSAGLEASGQSSSSSAHVSPGSAVELGDDSPPLVIDCRQNTSRYFPEDELSSDGREDSDDLGFDVEQLMKPYD